MLIFSDSFSKRITGSITAVLLPPSSSKLANQNKMLKGPLVAV